MQTYELLFILPGTLGEDEVVPVVEQVRHILTQEGAVDVDILNKGKSRLAYPIKHIRYGYFQLGYFSIDRSKLGELQQKLRHMSTLLRAQINKYDPTNPKLEGPLVAISDVTIRNNNRNQSSRVAVETNTGDTKPQEESAEAMAVEEINTIKAKDKKLKKKSEELVETKAEDVKMEDIDKKLNELLDSDLSEV